MYTIYNMVYTIWWCQVKRILYNITTSDWQLNKHHGIKLFLYLGSSYLG